MSTINDNIANPGEKLFVPPNILLVHYWPSLPTSSYPPRISLYLLRWDIYIYFLLMKFNMIETVFYYSWKVDIKVYIIDHSKDWRQTQHTLRGRHGDRAVSSQTTWTSVDKGPATLVKAPAFGADGWRKRTASEEQKCSGEGKVSEKKEGEGLTFHYISRTHGFDLIYLIFFLRAYFYNLNPF